MAKKGDVDVEENLYGCYLLCCLNERFRGQTYIGYTVNPARRIRQHNRGVKAGGARRTSNRGPWDMVLMIHGFINCNSALKFEWAWQHPDRSRRLRHVAARRKKETPLQYRYRVCCEMLLVGPWTRLPLTVRWLQRHYYMEFDARLRPPPHMPVVFGAVLSQKVAPVRADDGTTASQNHGDEDGAASSVLPSTDPLEYCYICESPVETNSRLRCLNSACVMRSHLTCLALVFSAVDDYLLPVEGQCPACSAHLLWGDLIRAKNGSFRDQLQAPSGSQASPSDDHWADELQRSSSSSYSPNE